MIKNQNKIILVTGSAGFIGYHLSSFFLKLKYGRFLNSEELKLS